MQTSKPSGKLTMKHAERNSPGSIHHRVRRATLGRTSPPLTDISITPPAGISSSRRISSTRIGGEMVWSCSLSPSSPSFRSSSRPGSFSSSSGRDLGGITDVKTHSFPHSLFYVHVLRLHDHSSLQCISTCTCLMPFTFCGFESSVLIKCGEHIQGNGLKSEYQKRRPRLFGPLPLQDPLSTSLR